MSQVILQGFASGKVPVTANTATVFNAVVLPWLQSGANGLVNWRVLAGEPTQQTLLEAATDRYVNGLPIVRGDMPAYAGQGYTTHEPSISSVLAQAQGVPTVSSAVATQQVAAVPSQVVNQATQLASQYPAPSVGAAPADTSAGFLQQLLSQNGVGMTSPAAQNVVGQVAAQGVTQTAYGPPPASTSGLPSWLVPGGIAAVVAAKVLL